MKRTTHALLTMMKLAIIITNNHAKFGYTKIITKHQFIVIIITTIIILNETRFYWQKLKSKYALSMAKYIYMYSTHKQRIAFSWSP